MGCLMTMQTFTRTSAATDLATQQGWEDGFLQGRPLSHRPGQGPVLPAPLPDSQGPRTGSSFPGYDTHPDSEFLLR